jgi:predicted component of type VI protein secretion system
MNELEALLVVERGPVPTTQIQLQNEQFTVGRSAGNDLILADPEVSRRHIRIIRRADGFAVEDIGSTNGTFVNGQRISHLTLLQDGDAIDLGDTVRLRYISMAQPPDDDDTGPLVDTTEKPTQAYVPTAAPAVERPVERPRPVAATVGAPAAIPTQPPPAPAYTPPPSYVHEEPRRGRGLWVGCGLLVALLLVCAGTFLVLDAYDQGRLLYCGPLAPVFEIVLGPFGYAPICP